MASVDVSVVVGYAGALLAFVLALVVIRAGQGSATDRVLASLLVFEGLVQAAFATAGLAESPSRWEEEWVAIAFWATAILSVLYLRFLSRLDTPLVAWLRGRGARGTFVVLLVALPTVALVATAVFRTRPEYVPGEQNFFLVPLVLGMLAFSIICMYALLAAISVLRRAPAGPRRAQARAYVTAFGARDALFLTGIGSNFLGDVIVPGVGIPNSALLQLSSIAGSLATLVFVPLLAYGLLKTQLFDIDLKIKVGIRRSTVVTVMLVVALGAAKVAEFYLSKTFGLIAGGVAAGGMLVLAPRLNKMGEKVANVAMPQVQPTPVYVQFKKLEVYRATVESTMEEGGIDAKQRAVLDRLRVKLALSADDCRAVEDELLATQPRPGPPAAST